MKKFRFYAPIVSLATLLSVSWTPVVVSQSNDTDETQPTSTSQEIKTRVLERKDRLRIALQEAEKKHLGEKCERAQGLVNGLLQKLAALQTNRVRVYDDIDDKLTKLIEKLQAKGVDTAKLEGNQAEYKAKVEVFKTHLAEYKLALEDLKDMDCTEDPEGFKATLEEARQIRDAMKEDAKSIRQYVVTVIKATLKEIRAAIAEVNDENQPTRTEQ